MTTRMEQEDLAMMFILGADNKRYAILKQELQNDFSKGHDNYPTTLAKARMMLANRQDKATTFGTRRADSNNTSNNNTDVAFTTDGQTRRGTGACYCCGSREHRANTCPNRHVSTGNTNVTNGNEGTGGGNTTGINATPAQSSATPAAPAAVQMLLDGVEDGAYDDTCEYANLFVTMDDEEKKQQDPPPSPLERGVCDICTSQGQVGSACDSCVGGRYRSMYGRCGRCMHDGPIGTRCISCPPDIGHYVAVQDGNHGFQTTATTDTITAHSTSDKTEHGFLFLNPKGTLPRDWILLDNQSTVNVFCNKELLVDVRETDRTMVIRCNAGVAQTNMMGRLPGYAGEVWYYPT
jgi:hypothetical protein